MRERRKSFCISRVVEGKATAGSGVDGPGIVPTRPEQLRREWRESGKEGLPSRSPLGTWPWGGGNQRPERASALYSGVLHVCPPARRLGPVRLRPYYLRSCVQAVSTRAVRDSFHMVTASLLLVTRPSSRALRICVVTPKCAMVQKWCKCISDSGSPKLVTRSEWIWIIIMTITLFRWCHPVATQLQAACVGSRCPLVALVGWPAYQSAGMETCPELMTQVLEMGQQLPSLPCFQII